MLTLLSPLRLAEARLWIAHPDDAPRNASNLRLPAGPKARELWLCDIAFAPMTVASLAALLASLETLDGRLSSVLVPLSGYTQPNAFAATLGAATIASDSSVTLAMTAGGTIKAGTLFTVGSPDVDRYQLFEALADTSAATSTSAVVPVAPRVRWAFPAGAPVSFVPIGRFRRRDDRINDAGNSLSRGDAALQLVEAIHV